MWGKKTMSMYESKGSMALKQKLLTTIKYDFENKDGGYNAELRALLVKDIDSISLGGYYLDLVMKIGSPKIVLAMFELYFSTAMPTMVFNPKTKVLTRLGTNSTKTEVVEATNGN